LLMSQLDQRLPATKGSTITGRLNLYLENLKMLAQVSRALW